MGAAIFALAVASSSFAPRNAARALTIFVAVTDQIVFFLASVRLVVVPRAAASVKIPTILTPSKYSAMTNRLSINPQMKLPHDVVTIHCGTLNGIMSI